MNDKYNKLYILQNYFQTKLNLTPVFGAELEFYLSDNIDINQLSNFIGYFIEKEKGNRQYEIQFKPHQDLVRLAKTIEDVRDQINDFSAKNNGLANFSSKPNPDDYGNSMHVHINFLENDIPEKYANILCAKLYRYIDFCLPKPEDYERLDQRFMAPTHIAWGGNNRTAMIRIPDSLPRRLEHRLPAASADPALLFYGLLKAIKEVLESGEDISLLPKIHGNSFDKQYGLVTINRKFIPELD